MTRKTSETCSCHKERLKHMHTNKNKTKKQKLVRSTWYDREQHASTCYQVLHIRAVIYLFCGSRLVFARACMCLLSTCARALFREREKAESRGCSTTLHATRSDDKIVVLFEIRFCSEARPKQRQRSRNPFPQAAPKQETNTQDWPLRTPPLNYSAGLDFNSSS